MESEGERRQEEGSLLPESCPRIGREREVADTGRVETGTSVCGEAMG